MADQKFRVGEVVKLKSSSLKMTVGGYNTHGDVICRWFAGTDSKTDTFPEDALEPAPEKPSASTERRSHKPGNPWS